MGRGRPGGGRLAAAGVVAQEVLDLCDQRLGVVGDACHVRAFDPDEQVFDRCVLGVLKVEVRLEVLDELGGALVLGDQVADLALVGGAALWRSVLGRGTPRTTLIFSTSARAAFGDGALET